MSVKSATASAVIIGISPMTKISSDFAAESGAWPSAQPWQTSAAYRSGLKFSVELSPDGGSSMSLSCCISMAWKLIGGIGIRRWFFLLFTDFGRPWTSQWRSYQLRTILGFTNPCSRFATAGTSSPFSKRSCAVIRKIRFRFVAPVLLMRLLWGCCHVRLMHVSHLGAALHNYEFRRFQQRPDSRAKTAALCSSRKNEGPERSHAVLRGRLACD